MSKITIKEDIKVPGTDYVLEKGDSIHFHGMKTMEDYRGHSVKPSNINNAFKELLGLLGAETVAKGLLRHMNTRDRADALTEIYVDFVIDSVYLD